MPYTPDPTNPAEPADIELARTAAAEFRALKESLPSYKTIPRREVGWATGECLVTTGDVSLDSSDVVTGYCFSLLNDGDSQIHISAGGAVVLRLSGTVRSSEFLVPPHTLVTLWCDTDESVVVAAVQPPDSEDIIELLGYVPYDASNPDGFISGIDSDAVTTALGYTPANIDGSNAVGTWSINISGNANTATQANNATHADTATHANAATTVDNLYSAQVIAALGYTPVNPASLPLYSMYSVTSADIDIPTASALIQVGHGASTPPTIFSAWWKCILAEHGYSPGDRVQIQYASLSDNGKGYFIFANAGFWGLRYNTFGGTPTILPKTVAGPVTLSSANWKLIFTGIWMVPAP